MFFQTKPFTYKFLFKKLAVCIFSGHYAFCVGLFPVARREAFSGESQLSYTFKKGAPFSV